MTRRDRHGRLITRLRQDGPASVAVLARDLGVTPSTIRRDLAHLAEDGRLLRTYGGAALSDRALQGRRQDPAAEAKRAIGAAAARLVEDGQTVLISSGSTTLELARHLVDRRLTIITNALDVAQLFLDRERIELIVLGGVVRAQMHSTLGHLAELALAELRADTLFMGIGAIDPDRGLMNDSIPEIQTDRALRRSARQCVVLADSSKFSQVAPAFVFGLEDVQVVVTDAGVARADVTALEMRGVRVIVADAPSEGRSVHR